MEKNFLISQEREVVLQSLLNFKNQLKEAWLEVKKIPLFEKEQEFSKILLCGMGGSALPGYFLKSVFEKEMKIPLEIVNHYDLPAWVDRQTLLFFVSYSGQTEETIAATFKAKKRNLKGIIIASGGSLAKLAKKWSWPCYLFTPKANPSKQPRLGLGYPLASLLGILKRLKILNVSEEEMKEVWQNLLPEEEKKYLPDQPWSKNLAKKIALASQNKVLILLGGEHLLGNLHILANQINENAKQFAYFFPLPEMNHHLLEGLSFPQERKFFHFLFLSSSLYHQRVQERLSLTSEVLQKQGFSFSLWSGTKKKRFLSAFEALVFGNFLSFYLACLNQTNPLAIPWVDYFKSRLSNLPYPRNLSKL